MRLVEIKNNCLLALAGVLSAGKATAGSDGLQELAYLANRLGVFEVSHVNFVLDDHGPYSSLLDQVLREALQTGHFTKTRYVDEVDDVQYQYGLSGKGFKLLEGLSPSTLHGIQSVARRLWAESWKTLELAAVADFVRSREQLSLEESTRRALVRKPAYESFVGRAEQLLGELERARIARSSSVA